MTEPSTTTGAGSVAPPDVALAENRHPAERARAEPKPRPREGRGVLWKRCYGRGSGCSGGRLVKSYPAGIPTGDQISGGTGWTSGSVSASGPSGVVYVSAMPVPAPYIAT